MVYFNDVLCQKAFKLVKESKDFLDEANDLIKISCILNGIPISVDKIRQYDDELRNKYPEINVINSLAESVRWKSVNPLLCRYRVSVREIENIKFDKFCILARVLKNAGEIGNYIDFFDKQYIEN